MRQEKIDSRHRSRPYAEPGKNAPKHPGDASPLKRRLFPEPSTRTAPDISRQPTQDGGRQSIRAHAGAVRQPYSALERGVGAAVSLSGYSITGQTARYPWKTLCIIWKSGLFFRMAGQTAT